MAKKVSAGDPLVIGAGDWNTLLDVADLHRREQPMPSGLTGSRPVPSGVIVQVKNSTGGDLDRFHAVGLDDPIYSPTDNLDTFKNQLVFDGKDMSDAYFGLWAVYQSAVADGKIGPAMIHGVTLAEITVGHADHDRVSVDTDGGTKLISNFYGAGQILYKEDNTGTKWAIIRIGEFVAPIMKAIADGAISAGASGSADIVQDGSVSEGITAHLDWMHDSVDVNDNEELLVRFFKDQNKWIIIGAECP